MYKWLLALLTGASIAVAAPATMANGDGGTYLALGDSVAAGTQQPNPFTENGYTDNLFKHLKDRYGFDNFVKLACPGEDTAEMVAGTGSLCYGPGMSQLDAAVGHLLTNPGQVRLITIAIGANDVLVCDPNDPAVDVCLAGQLAQIGDNLPVIIGALQLAAPGVPIVAMNYYNPTLAFWVVGPDGAQLATRSLPLTDFFNTTLEDIYSLFAVTVADVETTYKTFKTEGGDPPQNVRAVCLWTRMCEKSGLAYVLSDFNPATSDPDPDIHPSNKGYKKIAGAHADLIDGLGIFD